MLLPVDVAKADNLPEIIDSLSVANNPPAVSGQQGVHVNHCAVAIQETVIELAVSKIKHQGADNLVQVVDVQALTCYGSGHSPQVIQQLVMPKERTLVTVAVYDRSTRNMVS